MRLKARQYFDIKYISYLYCYNNWPQINELAKGVSKSGIPLNRLWICGNRLFKLLVQGFSHYGGASGQVGISASEAQPARPNFETKMQTIIN